MENDMTNIITVLTLEEDVILIACSMIERIVPLKA